MLIKQYNFKLNITVTVRNDLNANQNVHILNSRVKISFDQDNYSLKTKKWHFKIDPIIKVDATFYS